MVQAEKTVRKDGVTILNEKGKRVVKKRFQGANKYAPVKSKKTDALTRKITSKIGKNIENIMAARVLHEGGVLRVIKPESGTDISQYVKSGPQLSATQVKLRAGQNARRKYVSFNHYIPCLFILYPFHSFYLIPFFGYLCGFANHLPPSVDIHDRAKADAYQEMVASSIKKIPDTVRRIAEEEAPIKIKSKPLKRVFPKLADDDVAGPLAFMGDDGANAVEDAFDVLGNDDETGESKQSEKSSKEETIDPRIKSKREKKMKEAFKSIVGIEGASLPTQGKLAKEVMPGRRAGFKGVASASAAAMLEEGF